MKWYKITIAVSISVIINCAFSKNFSAMAWRSSGSSQKALVDNLKGITIY
jgi:hypothetical protein